MRTQAAWILVGLLVGCGGRKLGPDDVDGGDTGDDAPIGAADSGRTGGGATGGAAGGSRGGSTSDGGADRTGPSGMAGAGGGEAGGTGGTGGTGGAGGALGGAGGARVDGGVSPAHGPVALPGTDPGAPVVPTPDRDAC